MPIRAARRYRVRARGRRQGERRRAQPPTCRGCAFSRAGPGQQSPRPKGRDGWLDRALRDYRVLLLDQRGTGRSTPANRLTLAGLGTPEAQAEYLTHFRADSIVADAELIRQRLTAGAPVERARAELWRVLRRHLPVPGARRRWPRRSSPAGCPASRPRPTTCTRRRIRWSRPGTRPTTSGIPTTSRQARQIAAYLLQQGGPAAVGCAAHRGGIPGARQVPGHVHGQSRPALPARGCVRRR